VEDGGIGLFSTFQERPSYLQARATTNQKGCLPLACNAGMILGNRDMEDLSSAWINPSIFGEAYALNVEKLPFGWTASLRMAHSTPCRLLRVFDAVRLFDSP
jgi:hypothetical protein